MYLAKINEIIEKQIELATSDTIKEKLLSLRPKQNIFQKLTKKDLTKAEYEHIINQIIDIIFPEVIKQYPFSKYGTKEELNYLLYIELHLYYDLYYSIEMKDKSFKVYPVMLNNDKAKRLYEKDIKDAIYKHLESGTPIEILITQRIQEYKEKTKQYKEYLTNTDMEPYYGDPNFMYKRAEYITKCANKLEDNPDNINGILENMKLFYNKYPVEDSNSFHYKSYPYFDEEFKREYQIFEKNYLEILNIENRLAPMVEKRWQEFLSNPDNHIVHAFTKGLVDPAKMTKACCSLATKNLLTIPYGNCGLIFDFNMDAVEVMCTEDAGSWSGDKETFIDRYLPKTWQLPDPDGTNLFYEFENLSKLILPEDLERDAIARNIAYNGEILNYEKHVLYSEIYLNSKAKAIGVFYTDNCRNIEEVEAYAKKYNLPLKHLSLRKLREDANVPEIKKTEEFVEDVDKPLSY